MNTTGAILVLLKKSSPPSRLEVHEVGRAFDRMLMPLSSIIDGYVKLKETDKGCGVVGAVEARGGDFFW